MLWYFYHRMQRLMQCTITAGSETPLENIYTDEASCEMTFRKLVNDIETNIERVMADRPGYLARSMTINPTASGSKSISMPVSAKVRSSIV